MSAAATRPEDDAGFAGKVAIIAGGGAAGDGIGNGRAAAILLARAGTKVLVVDREGDLAERTVAMIKSNPKAAAETYLALVKERATVEEVAHLLTQPGAIYQPTPIRTMVYAEYMAKAGFIKPTPKSWKDYFFPLLHDRDGS